MRHVVIIGAGFGGLACARKLAKDPDTCVTLIDRQNHHLFQPLLYQVATTTLSTSDVARSIRSIFSEKDYVDIRYDEAVDVDLNKKSIYLKSGVCLRYDALVVATGARTGFFGNDHWAPHVHQLKSLEDAIEIRKKVLNNLELADQKLTNGHNKLSTVVIIGGGPTGVELAGAFSDLIKRNMKRSFRRFDTNKQRIILLEGQDQLLGAFAKEHGKYTADHLSDLGVEVRTSAFVEDIQPEKVILKSGEVIDAATIIWTAGVEAAGFTRLLDAELTRGGLVKVRPDLSIPGHPSAFVIGDAAAVFQPDGSLVPGVAPAAAQAGNYVAKMISKYGPEYERNIPFRYRDKGKMAIVGKGSAVVQIKDWRTHGWLGWMIWLFVHVLFLVDFRSKVGVMLNWFWAYIHNIPGTRVFTGNDGIDNRREPATTSQQSSLEKESGSEKKIAAFL